MSIRENLYSIFIDQARSNINYLCNDYDKYIEVETKVKNTTKNKSVRKLATINLSIAYYFNNEIHKALDTLKSLDIDDLNKREKISYYYNLLLYSTKIKDEETINYVITEGKKDIDSIKEKANSTYNIFYINYYNYKGLYEESKKLLLEIDREKLSEGERVYYNLLQAEYYVYIKNYYEAANIINQIIKYDEITSPIIIETIKCLSEKCIENGVFIEDYYNKSNEEKNDKPIINILKKLSCIPIIHLVFVLILNTITNFKNSIKEKWFIYFAAPFGICFFGCKVVGILSKKSLYNSYWTELCCEIFMLYVILCAAILCLRYILRNKCKNIKFILFIILMLIGQGGFEGYNLINNIYDFSYVISNNYAEEVTLINNIEKEDGFYKIELDGFEDKYYIPVNDKNSQVDKYYIDDKVIAKYLPNAERILDIVYIEND
ncbi:hypothetical protein UT300005_10290 [Clostridium sp. CTA-5]